MSLHIKNYHGAGVLFFRYNKETFEILLGKRSIRQGYGRWAIPGGGLERKDGDYNYRACAFRELWEETGIDIRTIKTQDIAQTRIDLPFFHWRTFLVMARGPFSDFRIREFSELRWIPISELGNYDLWISLNREIRTFTRLSRLPDTSESR